MRGGDPVDDRVAFLGELAGDETPGNQEEVGRFHVGEGVLDVEVDQPVVVAEAATLGRTDDDLVVGKLAQHLVGPDGVEQGESGVEADGDLHGGVLPVWFRGRRLGRPGTR